jgi:aryl carrier-like protein
MGLIGALDDLGVAAPVWIVTRGAVRVAQQELPADLGQAQLWGLGHALAAHRPERTHGLFDLPYTMDPAAARRLAQALADHDGERELALRAAGLFVRRLVPADADEAAELWRPHGTVVVTGAATVLGEHLTRWAAGHDEARVLLPVAPEELEAPLVVKLRNDFGDRLTIVACDPADRAAQAELLAAVPAEHPVTAVLYVAAAPLDDDATSLDIRHIDRESATVDMATHLEELTRDGERPPLFVVVSSVAAAFGLPGAGNAAPGHAYLDALTARRAAAGLPARCLQVVPWADGDGSDPMSTIPLGIAPAPPESVVALIERLPRPADQSMMVADIDWERLVPRLRLAGGTTLFRGVPAAREALDTAEGLNPAADGRNLSVLRRLTELPEAERIGVLLELIRVEAAAVLGHATTDAVEADGDLVALGLSSFTALELSTRMRAVGLTLSATAMFDNPTPAAIARHVLTGLAGGDNLQEAHHE